MASPVADSYSIASGADLYAGMNAPAGLAYTLPTAGNAKSVHLNALSSINPCPGDACWYSGNDKMNGWAVNWTGAIFAPLLGDYGSVIFAGGGHLGYDGTELHRFDIATGLWSMIGAPVATDFIGSLDFTWLDVDAPFGKVFPASHTYGSPCYVGPEQGGGEKGSFVLPYNVFSEEGRLGSGQPHAVDLVTGMSSRFTTNTVDLAGSGGGYGGAFVDTVRNNLWCLSVIETDETFKIPLGTGSRTAVKTAGANKFQTAGYYGCLRFVEGFAVSFFLYSGQLVIKAYVVGANTLTHFNVDHGPRFFFSATNNVGFDWCPITRKFYLYEGLGQTQMHTCTPPADVADWTTGEWMWGTEAIGGDVPANVMEVKPSAQGAQPFTKFMWLPSVECFGYASGLCIRTSPDGVSRDGAFTLIRPLGT